VRLVLACTLVVAAVAGLYSLSQERDYRARAFVIQVPSDLGGRGGVELARSEGVLLRAIALSGVGDIDASWLRDHSKAELTSRLDLAFTVTAPEREDAAALATAYAKSFRAAIPDDRGLPVRGRGATQAQSELGPFGWALLGGFVGFGVGLTLVILRDGLRGRRRSVTEAA
jgi:hypothetical protein